MSRPAGASSSTDYKTTLGLTPMIPDRGVVHWQAPTDAALIDKDATAAGVKVAGEYLYLHPGQTPGTSSTGAPRRNLLEFKLGGAFPNLTADLETPLDYDGVCMVMDYILVAPPNAYWNRFYTYLKVEVLAANEFLYLDAIVRAARLSNGNSETLHNSLKEVVTQFVNANSLLDVDTLGDTARAKLKDDLKKPDYRLTLGFFAAPFDKMKKEIANRLCKDSDGQTLCKKFTWFWLSYPADTLQGVRSPVNIAEVWVARRKEIEADLKRMAEGPKKK